MTYEWVELNDIGAVAIAQGKGWEIEFQSDPGNDKYCPWLEWCGNAWRKNYLYRGRPKQPKKVIVTSECWRHKHHHGLSWAEDLNAEYWQRFPAGDITGEVEV